MFIFRLYCWCQPFWARCPRIRRPHIYWAYNLARWQRFRRPWPSSWSWKLRWRPSWISLWALPLLWIWPGSRSTFLWGWSWGRSNAARASVLSGSVPSREPVFPWQFGREEWRKTPSICLGGPEDRRNPQLNCYGPGQAFGHPAHNLNEPDSALPRWCCVIRLLNYTTS